MAKQAARAIQTPDQISASRKPIRWDLRFSTPKSSPSIATTKRLKRTQKRITWKYYDRMKGRGLVSQENRQSPTEGYFFPLLSSPFPLRPLVPHAHGFHLFVKMNVFQRLVDLCAIQPGSNSVGSIGKPEGECCGNSHML